MQVKPLQVLAAAAVLGLLSVGAYAATPPIPQPFVTPVGPVPNSDSGTGNGGLIITVFDTVRQVSLTEYLGVTIDQFLPGAGNATPEAGLSFDFGTLSGFSTVFGTSDVANIQYTITAGDSIASSGSQTGQRLATTLAAGTGLGFAGGTVRNSAANGAILAQRTAIGSILLGASNCNGVNPCNTVVAADSAYLGGTNWGKTLGVTAGITAGSAAGTPMGFYLLTVSSETGSQVTTKQQYANSANSAQWLLTTDGKLTYTLAASAPAVPLPAAAWLLISGLLGLGTVSRRRRGIAAA
jgi:hypothetical protein